MKGQRQGPEWTEIELDLLERAVAVSIPGDIRAEVFNRKKHIMQSKITLHGLAEIGEMIRDDLYRQLLKTYKPQPKLDEETYPQWLARGNHNKFMTKCLYMSVRVEKICKDLNLNKNTVHKRTQLKNFSQKKRRFQRKWMGLKYRYHVIKNNSLL